MPRRIKPAGKGFVTLDGNLLNLSNFKSILKNPLGRFEDPDKEIGFSIGFTPVNPSAENEKNNVDGTTFITYNTDEEKDFNADYNVILKAHKDEGIFTLNNTLMYIVLPIVVGLILWAIAKIWA